MEKIDKRTKEYKDTRNCPPLTGEEKMSLSRPVVDAEVCPHGIPIEMADNCYGCRMTKARVTFDHCPSCGAELLEDEKSYTCEAHCRKCIYKEY